MNKKILLLLIGFSLWASLLESAKLNIKNNSKGVIKVELREDTLNDEAKEKIKQLVLAYTRGIPSEELLSLYKVKQSMTLYPGKDDDFNTGFRGIYLLTFSEVDTDRINKIARGEKIDTPVVKLVAGINPDIEWSDVQSSVIYNSPTSIKVYNSATKALRKAGVALEIIGGAVFPVALPGVMLDLAVRKKL
ncbi:MAG: hypothetical protein WC707_02880 [Candidatus Babeliaceae bacterium]|jgi:hypothetical protein